MRVLVVTQKVDKDDGYFGFFHDWLTLLAAECRSVVVIALEVRAHALPPNVSVYSLGKEDGVSRIKYLKRFCAYAWGHRDEYDVVFCHMNPPYVILGAPLWKMLRKPIALWYVHRHVDVKLRLATFLADHIFSASKESFRIQSPKVEFLRQGVDTDAFTNPDTQERKLNTPLRIVSVGRLTPIKNLDVLIRAAALLKEKGVAASVTLVGSAVAPTDRAYESKLRDLVKELSLEGVVIFAGSMPFVSIRDAYWNSDVSVNLAPTGGMDKAVLESLAAGTPAMVTNRAFEDVLGEEAENLIFIEGDPSDLADRLAAFSVRTDREQIGAKLQERVRVSYSLRNLIHAIAVSLQGLISHEKSH